MWHAIVGCWIVSCYVAHQWASWNVLLIARPSCSVLQLSAHQVHSPLVDHIALVILAACIPNRYFARWDSRIMDPQYLHHPASLFITRRSTGRHFITSPTRFRTVSIPSVGDNSINKLNLVKRHGRCRLRSSFCWGSWTASMMLRSSTFTCTDISA